MTRHSPLPRVVVVTGTDTDVGKTIVTAAIAARLVDAGRSTAAYKPTQTGVGPGEPGDMAAVERLSGVRTEEGCRFREPMAPRPAAALDQAALPTLADHLAAVGHLLRTHDHVIVEGAGGLLVELTDDGRTLADLARELDDVGVVIVARSALGTLNHTMLTREALACRQLRSLGIVVGSWPAEPSHLEQTNRDYFAGLPEGLLGAIPAGVGSLDPQAFSAMAVASLDRLLDGRGVVNPG